MESGIGPATWSIASAQLRATRSSETMWLFDRIRPVMPGDDRLAGRGSRPTPAYCCAQYAMVRSSNTGGVTQSGSKASSPPLVDDGAALRWPDGGPRPSPWRKIDVILPRHDLRERDHQWRQRNADNSLRGQGIWSWPLSGRRARPPSHGLERALHRDDASARASRLSRDLRQPLLARGGRPG